MNDTEVTSEGEEEAPFTPEQIPMDRQAPALRHQRRLPRPAVVCEMWPAPRKRYQSDQRFGRSDDGSFATW